MMNRFLSFVLLLIVIAVSIGFFRGWFSMTAEKEPFSEKRDFHLKVDSGKMKQDVNEMEVKTKALFNQEKGDSKIPN